MRAPWIAVMSRLCAFIYLVSFNSLAYDIDTHIDMSSAAASKSLLSLSQRTPGNLAFELGLRADIADESERFPDSRGNLLNALGLLQSGVAYEDNISLFPIEIRVLRHFYSPLTGKGLDRGLFPDQVRSPDWTLSPRDLNSDQKFSYWDGRHYLYEALTSRAKLDRDKFVGLAFQTVGHVIHHLQDMAQPQHVRNDPHCDIPFCALGGLYGSAYFENFTDKPDIRARLPFHAWLVPNSLPYPSAAGSCDADGYDDIERLFSTSNFRSPRQFWSTQPLGLAGVQAGKGISEFTHRNFVSDATNFVQQDGHLSKMPEFPLPEPGMITREQVGNLIPGSSLSGEIWFVGNSVSDNLTGRTVTNPRASSFSIFDEDVSRKVGFRMFPTINRFVVEEAHKCLIPRAVAYSAGMINYFFRGKIDAIKSRGSVVFRNLTDEDMSGAFALYKEDRQGVRELVSGGEWNQQIGAQGVGTPVAIPTIGFSQNEPSAYMLVFKGDLGEEKAGEGMLGAVAARRLAPKDFFNGADLTARPAPQVSISWTVVSSYNNPNGDWGQQMRGVATLTDSEGSAREVIVGTETVVSTAIPYSWKRTYDNAPMQLVGGGQVQVFNGYQQWEIGAGGAGTYDYISASNVDVGLQALSNAWSQEVEHIGLRLAPKQGFLEGSVAQQLLNNHPLSSVNPIAEGESVALYPIEYDSVSDGEPQPRSSTPGGYVVRAYAGLGRVYQRREGRYVYVSDAGTGEAMVNFQPGSRDFGFGNVIVQRRSVVDDDQRSFFLNSLEVGYRPGVRGEEKATMFYLLSQPN